MELIIIAIILGAAILLLTISFIMDNKRATAFFLICDIAAFIFILVLYNLQIIKPTAIDIYRGNTALKITYQDSIPVDTIVVFKKQITMWIAREKRSTLYIFSAKPTYDEYWDRWRPSSLVKDEIFEDYEWDRVNHSYVILDNKSFPEVTFENSPKELVIKESNEYE